MDVERIVEGLLDDAVTPSASLLTLLSDQPAHETAVVVEALRGLSSERRRGLVRRLAELAEENVDLNFDTVFRRCLEDEDAEVREIAVDGLWECEERSLIPSLVQLLKEDREERVRAAAAQSLGRFALLAEMGKLLERDAHKVNKALLETIEGEEDSPEVQRRAIEAVAPINTPQVRDIILETYESASERLRASALYAMGRNGDPSWAPYVLEEMDSPEPELRYEAAGAAGRLGDETMIPPLIRMANDEVPEVQAAAVAAIGFIGGPAADRTLRRLLRHRDVRVRELAFDALGEMQAEQAPGVNLLRTSPLGSQDTLEENEDGETAEDEEEG